MEEQILGCLLYWGKVKEDEVGYSWHRLVYHCLDVAAVGKAYLESRPKLLRSIREALGCEREDLIQWFAFLLALYDAGKFAFSFQGLKPGGGEYPDGAGRSDSLYSAARYTGPAVVQTPVFGAAACGLSITIRGQRKNFQFGPGCKIWADGRASWRTCRSSETEHGF